MKIDDPKQWFEQQCAVWEEKQLPNLRLFARLLLISTALYFLGGALILFAGMLHLSREDQLVTFEFWSLFGFALLIVLTLGLIIITLGSILIFLRSLTRPKGQEWFDAHLLKAVSLRRFLTTVKFSSEEEARQWWAENWLWKESGPPQKFTVALVFFIAVAIFIFLGSLYMLFSIGLNV